MKTDFLKIHLQPLKLVAWSNKGRPNEEDLAYSDFKVLIDGRLGAKQTNISTINVPVLPISDELAAQFPPVFTYGESEGRAKPYILGQTFGYSPFKVQGTLRVFHYGQIDAQAHEYERAPFIYYGRGIEVVQGSPIGLLLESNANFDGTGLISIDEFSFDQDEDSVISDVNGLQIRASVDGDGVEIAAFADGFTVRRNGGEGIEEITYPQFNWVRQADDGGNVVLMDRGPSNAIINLGGDIEFVDIGGPWFRAAGAGSGVVEIDFGERNIQNARLVLRAIRNPFQTVEFLDNQPVSINPEFQSNGEVFNHVCTFRDLDTGKIRFNYDSTSVGANFALWFEEIELANPTPTKVTIDFDSDVASIDFVYTPNGVMQIQNFSQSTLSVVDGTNPDSTMYGTSESGGQFNQYTFDLVISSGLAVFRIDEVKEQTSNYGAFRTETGYILRPPPQVDFNDPFSGPITLAGQATLSAFIEDETQAFNAGVKYEYRARMRVIEGDLDSVNVNLSFPTLRSVRVGREWTDINIIIDNVNGNNLIVQAQVNRGVTSSVSPQAQNENVDFAIEIDFVKCHVLGNGVSDFPLYENTNGVDIRVPLYRVPDARIYHSLPTGIAFYDDKGRLAISEEYADVHGDFIGANRNETSISGFRSISLLASGIDHLTNRLNDAGNDQGERLSEVLDEQRPFFQHIAEMSQPLDYILSEFEDGQGFNIRRRWRPSDPVELVIQAHEIVHNSIQVLPSIPRKFRYEIIYRKNHRNERLTRKESSTIGFIGNFTPTIVDSPLRFRSDALDVVNNAIARDSAQNDMRSMQLINARLDILEGMAIRVRHPRMPKNNICIVREVTPLISTGVEHNTTQLLLKVLRI